jgi:uncharacterized protein (TIGR03435 family)
MAAPGVGAQDDLAFEAASIKVAVPPGAPPVLSPDRYNMTVASLTDLVVDAYGVQRYQVVGGPEWARGSVRFAVMAKAPFAPSRDEMRVMLRRMLSERFALRVHRDTRELPVYELRLARDDGRLGKQITRTTVDCAALKNDPRPPGARPACGELSSADPRGSAGLKILYQGSGVTIGDLSAYLSQYAGRTVLDRTGLSGAFDIELSFHPRSGFAGAPVEAISYFTAVEEQLGLKLDSAKGPVEVIVIDAADMPTPD